MSEQIAFYHLTIADDGALHRLALGSSFTFLYVAVNTYRQQVQVVVILMQVAQGTLYFKAAIRPCSPGANDGDAALQVLVAYRVAVDVFCCE